MATLSLPYTAGWDEAIYKSEDTQLDDTKLYDDSQDASFLLNDIMGENLNVYTTSLIRTSPIIDISSMQAATNSIIRWNASTPYGTDVKVETNSSFNEGLSWNGWHIVENGQRITDIFGSTVNLSNARIQIRQTLTTNNNSVTPTLYNLNIELIDSSALNEKEEWQLDTRLLAKFLGDLEGGNINNNGIRIEKFAIKRRKVDEIDYLTIGYKDFINNSKIEYVDYTQPNDNLIYSVVPIGENDLEGKPNDVSVESDFTGYFLVDAETNTVFAFDKAIGEVGNIDKQLNKRKVQIDTFYRFPRFININQKYHTFSLSTVLLPFENERSHKQYERLINLLDENKPLLVKGSNGSLYVCTVQNPKDTSPQNTWRGFDHITVTLDFTEVMTYEDYMGQFAGQL